LGMRASEETEGVRRELRLLLQLQEVDDRLEAVEKSLRTVPQRLTALDTHVAGVEGKLHNKRQELEQAEKNRRSLEIDVEDAEQKIRKYQGQLAEVKTNEQYQALLREIAGLREKVSGWEDEALACMEEADAGRKRMNEIEESLAAARNEAATARNKIEREARQLKERAAVHGDRRSAIVADLPEELVAAYERIRRGKGGVAIAALEGENCGVCHGFIPPQHIAEVKKANEIFYCHNCGRILVWKGGAAPE
jgi:predicted  nucleic acid-binding Zn-ribbon protein